MLRCRAVGRVCCLAAAAVHEHLSSARARKEVVLGRFIHSRCVILDSGESLEIWDEGALSTAGVGTIDLRVSETLRDLPGVSLTHSVVAVGAVASANRP